MEKFIIAEECATRVRIEGEGDRTIVLLHGYLESIEVWDDFIPLLQGVRVVAIDLPGHGVSQVMGAVHTMEFLARVVHGALEQLDIAEAFVVGHSMGGYVALEFLRLFPEATQGIVLLHSTPNADLPEKRENRLREIELVEAGKKELLAKSNPAMRFGADNRCRFADRIEDLADAVYLTDDAGIVAILRGMMERADYNEMLRQNAVPQLFIFGKHDEHIPLETAEELARAHPQARVVWLEHSGHMGFVEEPEITADALLSFVSPKPPRAKS